MRKVLALIFIVLGLLGCQTASAKRESSSIEARLEDEAIFSCNIIWNLLVDVIVENQSEAEAIDAAIAAIENRAKNNGAELNEWQIQMIRLQFQQSLEQTLANKKQVGAIKKNPEYQKRTFLPACYANTFQLLRGKQFKYEPGKKQQSETEKNKFRYDPGTKEQFVFKNVPEQLQRFGYRYFCTHTRSFACSERLPYSKYHGMNGYFESMEPVKTDSLGYEFRKVVLENGEKFYYVSNEQYGGVYSKSGPIVSLKALIKLDSYVDEPISPKSSIRVVSTEDKGGWFYLTLSNGTEFRDDQYQAFKRLISGVSNHESLDELSNLLAGLYLKYDKIEDRIFIRETGMEDLPIRAHIGHKQGNTWLRMELQYNADDWLFVRSFIVVADDVRYESPRVEFERDHGSGKIWEWYDISPNPDQMKLLRAVSTAQDVTVRFHGNQYYRDKKLSSSGKNILKNILRTYDLLTK